MIIRPYLTYSGSCAEAIELYKRALNAEVLQIMRFGDMPADPAHPIEIPEHMKSQVLQAMLRFGETTVRMSDCFGELNDPESERLAIAVECSEPEVRQAFAVLSEEGRIGIPLQATFFSPCHGVVFDKFGVMWNFVASA